MEQQCRNEYSARHECISFNLIDFEVSPRSSEEDVKGQKVVLCLPNVAILQVGADLALNV